MEVSDDDDDDEEEEGEGGEEGRETEPRIAEALMLEIAGHTCAIAPGTKALRQYNTRGRSQYCVKAPSTALSLIQHTGDQ
eukprot:1821026-Rhodomonas_salina.5